MHGKRSLLHLVCGELLFRTLLHSPWHRQGWGTQPEHFSAAGGRTALEELFGGCKDPPVLWKKQRDAGFLLIGLSQEARNMPL